MHDEISFNIRRNKQWWATKAGRDAEGSSAPPSRTDRPSSLLPPEPILCVGGARCVSCSPLQRCCRSRGPRRIGQLDPAVAGYFSRTRSRFGPPRALNSYNW
jgi:hypothetical protein